MKLKHIFLACLLTISITSLAFSYDLKKGDTLKTAIYGNSGIWGALEKEKSADKSKFETHFPEDESKNKGFDSMDDAMNYVLQVVGAENVVDIEAVSMLGTMYFVVFYKA